MSVETAHGLVRQARSQLKKMERDLATVRRLVAAAADELEKQSTTNRTPLEGHRDNDAGTHRPHSARAAA